MTAWLVVLCTGLASVAMRGAAVLTGGRTEGLAERLGPGLAASLLAALVVTQLWADDASVVATRLAGVGAAAALMLARAPALVALAGAAAAAALLRAWV